MSLLVPGARAGFERAETWARLPMVWSCKVSPDGRWVAWAWSGVGEAFDVYVAPTDGSASPRRLTDSRDDVLPRSWTADGRALVVARAEGGDDRDQLFRLAIDHPNRLDPLTAPRPRHFTVGGELHDNGRWLVYAANVDPVSGEATELHRLFRHDIVTGERRVLAEYRLGDDSPPEISPDGRSLLYHRAGSEAGGIEIWLADLEGRGDRRLVALGARTRIAAGWMPDGERLLLVAPTATHERVGIYRLADGRIDWLLDDRGRFVERALPDRMGRGIMILEVEAARLRASWLDLATRKETRIDGGAGTLMPVAALPGGDWVGLAYAATRPHELMRFSPAMHGRDARSLSRSADVGAPPAAAFVPAEDFRWRSADGLPIQGWLYRPHGPSKGAVIWVHGGPTWHSEAEANGAIQFLVGEGFTLLDVNYRGSTGFGIEYREAIKLDGWGGREQDDIRTGIEALIAAGFARAGRIGVAGVSYGGYSAWHAIAHWPDLVAAAVPICGMTDLAVDYAATEMPHGRLYSEEMMGGRPDEAAERYHERSPVNFVERIRGRLLVVHGLRDTNVSPANTEVACRALERARVPYELVTYPNEGHGVWKTSNRADLFRRMARLFHEAFAAT